MAWDRVSSGTQLVFVSFAFWANKNHALSKQNNNKLEMPGKKNFQPRNCSPIMK